MTYVHREHIDHPSAWTGLSIGGKQGLVYRLKQPHLDAFDAILAATADIEPLEVTRERFAHPAIEPLARPHARTPFKDSPSSKRSLLRLWLTVPNGRPPGEAYRLKAVGYRPGTQRE
jgi:hypothetical protein